jgi:hypothetical protein
MNAKHPYEKHLAEKLVQLPPPGDPDQNWQQMKGLLDKDMPRGGAGGPLRSYRWWITGAVVVAIVAGTWFGSKQFLTNEQRNEAVAGTIKTVNNQNNPGVAREEKNVGTPPTTTHEPDNSTAVPHAANTITADGDQQMAQRNAGHADEPTQQDLATDNATARPNNTGVANGNSSTGAGNTTSGASPGHQGTGTTPTNPPPEQTALERRGGDANGNRTLAAGNGNSPTPATTTSNNNKNNSNSNKLYLTPPSNSNNNSIAAIRTRNNGKRDNNHSILDEAVVANRNITTTRNRGNKGAGHKPGRAGNKPAAQDAYTYKPTILLPSQPSQPSGLLKESPVNITVNYTGAMVVQPSGVIQQPFSYYTQTELFPDLAVQQKSSKKSKGAYASAAQGERGFAAGLSLPLGFPLGDQQPLAFNRQGGANTISDFLPSPHVQFHLNGRTFLQTGVQFASPQFIRPILLYQSARNMGPGAMIYHSAYARKLYYFNLPVSVYHSPLKSFYMGAGLQFSSLVSGIAQFQEVKRGYGPGGQPQDYVLSNYYTKFRHDSLSSRINNNELRLLVDFNYYWSRFTVGLQYSQAFNNYVSFQVAPGTPYTFDKNKSLQFYLRYNIWEDKKNRSGKGPSLLSFK